MPSIIIFFWSCSVLLFLGMGCRGVWYCNNMFRKRGIRHFENILVTIYIFEETTKKSIIKLK